jgi:O-antigen/teichoic acid export membrane protein
MTGEQRTCALVYAAALAALVALCFVLIPRYGLVGAACATSAAVVLESILLFIAVKWRLGLNVFVFARAAA